MIFSAVILLAARSLGCLMLLARGEVSKDAEIPVLRHQNAELGRQNGRVRYQPADHGSGTVPAGPRHRRGQVFTETLAGCSLHRRLVSRAF